jgi:hypothetical protein
MFKGFFSRTPFSRLFDSGIHVDDNLNINIIETYHIAKEYNNEFVDDNVITIINEESNLIVNIIVSDNLNCNIDELSHEMILGFEFTDDLNIIISEDSNLDFDLILNDTFIINIGTDKILNTSDLLQDILNIVSTIEYRSYAFWVKDHSFIVKSKIDNQDVIKSKIHNVIRLRGGYQVPEINQNVEMWAGEAISLYVTGIVPEDFDNIMWRLLETKDATEYVLEKSLDEGSISIVGTDIIIDLNSSDTIDVEPNRYFHELRVWSGNDPNTVAIGRLKINPSTFIDVEV